MLTCTCTHMPYVREYWFNCSITICYNFYNIQTLLLPRITITPPPAHLTSRKSSSSIFLLTRQSANWPPSTVFRLRTTMSAPQAAATLCRVATLESISSGVSPLLESPENAKKEREREREREKEDEWKWSNTKGSVWMQQNSIHCTWMHKTVNNVQWKNKQCGQLNTCRMYNTQYTYKYVFLTCMTTTPSHLHNFGLTSHNSTPVQIQVEQMFFMHLLQ